jgi:hypothetical protein
MFFKGTVSIGRGFVKTFSIPPHLSTAILKILTATLFIVLCHRPVFQFSVSVRKNRWIEDIFKPMHRWLSERVLCSKIAAQ